MAEGVDYSEGYPGQAALKAAGKTFVCRYVPYNNVAKGLGMAEKIDLIGHGISIAMVFEMFGDDPKLGYWRGVELAKMALAGMNSLGFPSSVPIYFAVDWDAISVSEFAAIDDFLHGAATVIGAGRVGIYGGVKVINHCLGVSHSARWGWQTYAWSYGAISPYAHLIQYNNYATINGRAVDLDRSLKPDFGQFPRPALAQPIKVVKYGLSSWPDYAQNTLVGAEDYAYRIHVNAKVAPLNALPFRWGRTGWKSYDRFSHRKAAAYARRIYINNPNYHI